MLQSTSLSQYVSIIQQVNAAEDDAYECTFSESYTTMSKYVMQSLDFAGHLSIC